MEVGAVCGGVSSEVSVTMGSIYLGGRLEEYSFSLASITFNSSLGTVSTRLYSDSGLGMLVRKLLNDAFKRSYL